MKAHEAKESGKYARKQEDIDRINEAWEEARHKITVTKGQHITLFGRCDCWKPRTPENGRCARCWRFV